MSIPAAVPFFFRQAPMVCAPLPVMVTDMETTGLNMDRDGSPHDRHSIVQIGAVDLLTNKSFFGRCRPREGSDISAEAMAVNGVTREELMDPSLPSEGELLEAFSAWSMAVKGDGPSRLLGGVNPRFDLDFLKTSARHAGMSTKQFPFGRRTLAVEDLCTAEAYRRAVPIPEGGFSTDKCYLLLGLPCEPKPHNAYAGALFGARALDELLPAPLSARNIDAPTLVGATTVPECPNPFLVPSLRRQFDIATDLLVKHGCAAAALGLLDVPNRIQGDGKRHCTNPAFRANYQGLQRLASYGEDRALGFAFSDEELESQAAAVRVEWARMDAVVKQAKTIERALPNPVIPPDSEDFIGTIRALQPPDVIVENPVPTIEAPRLPALSTPLIP